MGKYWKLIGHYNGESQTYEALAGTMQTSPFTPDTDGRLIGIRILPGGEAATSLVEGIEFRLTCTIWTPNTMTFCVMGNGLRTVPATPQLGLDFEVDQPVKTNVQITLEARHNVATGVTNNSFVLGLFQTT